MKTILIILFLFPGILFSQEVHWAVTTPVGYYIDSDSELNLITSGDFFTQAIFDQDTFSSLPGALKDAFIAKYNKEGEYLWAKHFSHTGPVTSFPVHVNNIDEIITVITCGDSTLILPDSIFLPKGLNLLSFSATGTLNWFNNFGSKGSVWTLTSDELSIYVAGRFSQQLIAGDTLITFGGTSGFLAKFSHSGNPLWAREFEGLHYQPAITVPLLASVEGIAVSGNTIIVAGHFTDSLKTPIDTFGAADGYQMQFRIFLSGLDTAGNFNWIKYLEGGENLLYGTTARSGSGDLYIIAAASGETKLDNQVVLDNGSYALCIDTGGSIKWNSRVSLPTPGYWQETRCISHDETTGITSVVGRFNGTMTFPGMSMVSDKFDFYIAMFDSAGTFIGANHGHGKGPAVFAEDSYAVVAKDGFIALTAYHGDDFSFGNYYSPQESGVLIKINPSLLAIAEKESKISTLKIYPNPASVSIMLEYDQSLAQRTIKILDLTGKEIMLVNSTSDRPTIDISGLASGIYFIQLDNTGEVKKFVKY